MAVPAYPKSVPTNHVTCRRKSSSSPRFTCPVSLRALVLRILDLLGELVYELFLLTLPLSLMPPHTFFLGALYHIRRHSTYYRLNPSSMMMPNISANMTQDDQKPCF